ncbi:hypothetical protein GOARA_038_00020 [Gordonia araii NBRC 100433]|uniref:Uncharacterized protein n=1 Tax=Gordonia araii NBRC 100433 TaxID=1073574 RepID=G7H0T0_9ACTN|nr:hypothetical protein [Gordonia araii]NNG99208.1 hypothetical protein [Gordonia araii NBRC 100433]GAB09455.1 hypothetical protein GOARA_038_00020 [Gordonia araii NBRC 100433]
MYEALALLSLLICLAGALHANRLIDRSGEVRKSIGVVLIPAVPFLVTYYVAAYPDILLNAIGAYLGVSVAFWMLAYFQFGGNSLSKKDMTELWRLLAKKSE